MLNSTQTKRVIFATFGLCICTSYVLAVIYYFSLFVFRL